MLGGSQGAEIFGSVIPQVIQKLKEEGHLIEINQQCTSRQKSKMVDFYNKNKIKNYIFEFEKNIFKLILSSDLAITRCGASTTAELVYALTPFIAVPYPHSIDNHQYLNAKYYEKLGYCWTMEENYFSSTNLFNLVIEILKDKKKLENISENMRKNKNENVYTKIEKVIEKFI